MKNSNFIGPYHLFQQCAVFEKYESCDTTISYEISFEFVDGREQWNGYGLSHSNDETAKRINKWWIQKQEQQHSKYQSPKPDVLELTISSAISDNSENADNEMNGSTDCLLENNGDSGDIFVPKPSAPDAMTSTSTLDHSEGNIMGMENTETDAVREWMSTVVRLSEYTDLLIENGFDRMDMFSNLTIRDLKEMGITKMGHRKMIVAEATKLQYGQSGQHHIAVAPSYGVPIDEQGTAVPVAYVEGQ